MSQRSDALLRQIADKVHKMAEEGHFRKLAGDTPVPLKGSLVEDILQWRRGVVETEKHRERTASKNRTVFLNDPAPIRYRTLEDYEADIRENTPRKRAIPNLTERDGRVFHNPEIDTAPFGVAHMVGAVAYTFRRSGTLKRREEEIKVEENTPSCLNEGSVNNQGKVEV